MSSVKAIALMLLVPSVALAERWSTVGGATLGPAQSAVEVSVGYPGATVRFLHGVSGHADVGVEGGINYAYQGIGLSGGYGLFAHGVLRTNILSTEGFALVLALRPGVFTYQAGFPENAFTLPGDLTGSIHLTDRASSILSVNVSAWRQFRHRGVVYLLPSALVDGSA